MLNILIAMVLMIHFSGLPVWLSITLVSGATIFDYISDFNQAKIDHLRFMTIEKGIMNIILRITGGKG